MHLLTPPIDHGGEVRCYLRDPDGHLIEVGQRVPGARGQLHTTIRGAAHFLQEDRGPS